MLDHALFCLPEVPVGNYPYLSLQSVFNFDYFQELAVCLGQEATALVFEADTNLNFLEVKVDILTCKVPISTNRVSMFNLSMKIFSN